MKKAVIAGVAMVFAGQLLAEPSDCDVSKSDNCGGKIELESKTLSPRLIGGAAGAVAGGVAAGLLSPRLVPGGAYVGGKLGEAAVDAAPEALDAKDKADQHFTDTTGQPVNPGQKN